MVADCPEFLRTILELDRAIRTELSLPESAELNQELESVINLRNTEYLPRLSGFYREALGTLDGSSQGTRSILLQHGHNTIGVNATLSSPPEPEGPPEAGPSSSAWAFGDTV
ncbi:hypothetical protein ABW21_db0205185 [Orbilia brochopaga]|nr:hypothetical protein ABW21_db0205185 [Drechslerella brochopaga]